MTNYITSQAQVDWLIKVGNFEVVDAQYTDFTELPTALAKLKARIASLGSVFPEGLVQAWPTVNSTGYSLSKLDRAGAHIIYYVNEIAEATYNGAMSDAARRFDSIFDDFHSALEGTGLTTEHWDDIEDDSSI